MFRIRRIFDDALDANAGALRQAQEILRAQFPDVAPEKIDALPAQLRNPLRARFRTVLLVAQDARGAAQGAAWVSHEPELDFCYLDYIATARGLTSRGIGGALYDRVREEARFLGAVGVFCECLPDDPALSRDAATRKQNAARLRFYERYGARPIAGTAYETPFKPEDDNPPYLVFDDLGSARPLRRARARRIVRAILERKYGNECPPGYVDRVVASFRDDPVVLRPPRHVEEPSSAPVAARTPADRRVALVVTDTHAIHHVHDRGYVESPARIRAILAELDKTDLFERTPPRRFPLERILDVHAADYVRYFQRVCASLEPGRSVYPYVFPIRNGARPPVELAVRAGYYCIDTFTPLNVNAFAAARRAVDCALTAADAVLEGRRHAYALVRPPGHHAERRFFGGFCYFNSAAVAAQRLSAAGTVAMLDIDYHHGNGQQEIFLARQDVLTVSIHGHPRFAYPYFSGFAEEKGEGEGRGFNLNLPLPEDADGARHAEALDRALRRVVQFKPTFLVALLGLDTARGDPTGTWTLSARDFERNGETIGRLGLPTVVVQEGGYRTRNLGVNARHFFQGLVKGAAQSERA